MVVTIKMKNSLASVALLAFSQLVSAADTATCTASAVDNVYLYYQETGKTPEEAVQLYQAHVDKIKSLAQKNKFADFTIHSQDLAINTSSFGVDKVDATISISMQFAADYKAVTTLLKEAKASGFNSSRSTTETCPK